MEIAVLGTKSLFQQNCQKELCHFNRNSLFRSVMNDPIGHPESDIKSDFNTWCCYESNSISTQKHPIPASQPCWQRQKSSPKRHRIGKLQKIKKRVCVWYFSLAVLSLSNRADTYFLVWWSLNAQEKGFLRLKIIKNELNGRNGPGEVVHTQHSVH